jgi:hypothetical protein
VEASQTSSLSIAHVNLHRNREPTTDLSGGIDPCQMRKVRVGGHSNNFSVQLFELLDAITERNYLRGADKCADTTIIRAFDKYQRI